MACRHGPKLTKNKAKILGLAVHALCHAQGWLDLGLLWLQGIVKCQILHISSLLMTIIARYACADRRRNVAQMLYFHSIFSHEGLNI